MQITENGLTEINLPNLKLFKTGKVRSVYDLGDTLLIVASDRVSAFDYILPTGIPEKGKVLTEVSEFWFKKYETQYPHHLISTDVDQFPAETKPYRDILAGRTMWVKKTNLIEIECVVRGYIVGSGWKEYQKSGTVCDIPLPKGLQLAQELPEPIFTPAIKASSGHDENISESRMRQIVGDELTNYLKETSLNLYNTAREYAQDKGIILADTKFEFGKIGKDVILIDEVLTPDSSRFWDADTYQPGISPASFDKQIVRDYLENSGWDKKPPVPTLPADIVSKASQKYREVTQRLIEK